MDDADDGGGDGDGDGEDLRLSFLYIQTPDQPPPRPLCYQESKNPFSSAGYTGWGIKKLIENQ